MNERLTWTMAFFLGIALLVFGPLIGGMMVLEGDKALGNVVAWGGFVGGLALAVFAFTRLLRISQGPGDREAK
jgi:hypothetical protein